MRTTLLAIALLPLAAGCDRHDGERLARVGRVVTHKIEALTPARTPFGDPIGLRRNLEERVRERFRSDRYLAGQAIEVTAEENAVRLKGSVDQVVLKRRAVEIADATVGVEKVIDELNVLP